MEIVASPHSRLNGRDGSLWDAINISPMKRFWSGSEVLAAKAGIARYCERRRASKRSMRDVYVVMLKTAASGSIY